jgi:hypothetical protein
MSPVKYGIATRTWRDPRGYMGLGFDLPQEFIGDMQKNKWSRRPVVMRRDLRLRARYLSAVKSHVGALSKDVTIHRLLKIGS